MQTVFILDLIMPDSERKVTEDDVIAIDDVIKWLQWM